MGTYYIPRNVKGETRLLNIFTVKSLITTVAGTIIGSVFYLIFGLLLGLKPVGIGIMVFFAVVGFGVGAIKIPTLGGIPFTKKIGGESLDEIIRRYVKFKMNRKVYTYTKEEK